MGVWVGERILCVGRELQNTSSLLKKRKSTHIVRAGSWYARGPGDYLTDGCCRCKILEKSPFRSGPLNQLNAILSLLDPVDHYRPYSATGSAIGRPYLALSRIHTQVGVLNRLVLNNLGSSTARFWCYTV